VRVPRVCGCTYDCARCRTSQRSAPAQCVFAGKRLRQPPTNSHNRSAERAARVLIAPNADPNPWPPPTSASAAKAAVSARDDACAYKKSARRVVRRTCGVHGYASLVPPSAQRTANDYRLKVGRWIRSVWGTVSNGFPALRHAARPPTITNALKPCSRSRCATRALVASRGQVQ
jgi:hypothetical protein